MASLYADEDFPLPVVVDLRNSGHDVLTAHEAGQANQGIPDPKVLAFAINQSRALLTRNRWDFVRLHKQVQLHCGIIVCSKDPDFPAQSRKIHQSLLNHPVLDNQLIRITR
jgi:predicted nuclease of predicted toxin-antitoxin system